METFRINVGMGSREHNFIDNGMIVFLTNMEETREKHGRMLMNVDMLQESVVAED